MTIRAPFSWFGGKSRVAAEVWRRFGDVDNYVEPFFGSGAVLLARPHKPHTETVNDADGLLCNFWRAIRANPAAVAEYAEWPVNENDLHARHVWLVERKESLQARLEGDPDFYDAKAAGWWVWGICCWIGSGWCSGNGPWAVREVDGVRQLVHLGGGRGVNRKRVHLSGAGQGVNRKQSVIREWFEALAERLRYVRVCCGDWFRVCGPNVTFRHGITAVFLDPPYADTAARAGDLYRLDSLSVAHDVREWALANGNNPLMRIALCGYAGEHAMPSDWRCYAWKAIGGYGNQRRDKSNVNAKRERIWFSPHCLAQNDLPLFARVNS